MEERNKRSKSDGFYSIIKNTFFILLILQFAPMVISGIRTALLDALFPKTHVGYLPINGAITDASFYIKAIDEFAKDDNIKAILLKINCPGGYSGSCETIFSELKKLGEKKSLVAWIENVGGSGGYYIATAAKSIIASPLSMVGSIGVFMELPNVKELLTSWNIKYRYVQSGAYKTTGSAVKDISQDELHYLQKLSDSQYQQFVKDVAGRRNLSIDEHTIWADGKAFSGVQALELKLIDKLGSFNDAIDEIKKIAEIEDEIKLVANKKPTGLMRLVSGGDEFGQESLSLPDAFASFLYAIYTKFSHLQTHHNSSLI